MDKISCIDRYLSIQISLIRSGPCDGHTKCYIKIFQCYIHTKFLHQKLVHPKCCIKIFRCYIIQNVISKLVHTKCYIKIGSYKMLGLYQNLSMISPYKVLHQNLSILRPYKLLNQNLSMLCLYKMLNLPRIGWC